MLPGSVFSKAEALVCKVRCFLSLCVYGQPAFPLCILPHLALKCLFPDHQCYVLQTTLLSCLQELSQDSHCPLPSAFCASLPAYFLFTNGHVPSHQNTQSLFISFFPSEILHCNRAVFAALLHSHTSNTPSVVWLLVLAAFQLSLLWFANSYNVQDAAWCPQEHTVLQQ